MHSFHGLSSLPYGIHKTISIQFKKDFFQNLNVYCMHIFSFIFFSSPVHFHKLFDASAPLFTPCINNNNMHSMGSTFNTFLATPLQTQTDEQQTVAAFVRRSQLFLLLACMPSGNPIRLQKSLAHT